MANRSGIRPPRSVRTTAAGDATGTDEASLTGAHGSVRSPPHKRTRNRRGPDGRPRQAVSTAYCRVLLRAGTCGKPALPTLLGRGRVTRWAKVVLGSATPVGASQQDFT